MVLNANTDQNKRLTRLRKSIKFKSAYIFCLNVYARIKTTSPYVDKISDGCWTPSQGTDHKVMAPVNSPVEFKRCIFPLSWQLTRNIISSSEERLNFSIDWNFTFLNLTWANFEKKRKFTQRTETNELYWRLTKRLVLSVSGNTISQYLLQRQWVHPTELTLLVRYLPNIRLLVYNCTRWYFSSLKCCSIFWF